MNQLPRRALSRYGLTFQGNILSVNCQCRMLTRVRRTHSTSPVENSLITNPQEGEIYDTRRKSNVSYAPGCGNL